MEFLVLDDTIDPEKIMQSTSLCVAANTASGVRLTRHLCPSVPVARPLLRSYRMQRVFAPD